MWFAYTCRIISNKSEFPYIIYICSSVEITNPNIFISYNRSRFNIFRIYNRDNIYLLS